MVDNITSSTSNFVGDGTSDFVSAASKAAHNVPKVAGVGRAVSAATGGNVGVAGTAAAGYTKKENPVLSALDTGGTALTLGGMLVAPIAGGVAAPFKWIGNKLGAGNIVGRAFQEIGKTIGKVPTAMEKNVAEAADSVAGKVGAARGVANRLNEVAGRGSPLDAVDMTKGNPVARWRFEKAAKIIPEKAAPALEKRMKSLSEAVGNLVRGGAYPEMHNVMVGTSHNKKLAGLGEFHKAAEKVRGMGDLVEPRFLIQDPARRIERSPANRVIGTLNNYLEKLLGDMKNVSSGKVTSPAEIKELHNRLQKFEDMVGRVYQRQKTHHLGVMPPQMESAYQKIKQELTGKGIRPSKAGPMKYLEKASRKAGIAAFLSSPVKAMKSIPSAFARTKLPHALFGAGILASIAAGSWRTANSVGEQLHAEKDLCASLEGKNPDQISTWHALFDDDVPDAVKESREQMKKSLAPKVVMESLANASDALFLFPSVGMVLPIAGTMTFGMLADAFGPEHQILPIYQQMKEAQKAGVAIPPITYAEFITAASEEVEKAGGVYNGLVMDMAKEYAAKQVQPEDILRDMQSGRFNQRAAELQQQRKAAGIAAGEMSPEAQLQAKMNKVNAELQYAKEHKRDVSPEVKQMMEEIQQTAAATETGNGGYSTPSAIPTTNVMTAGHQLSTMQQNTTMSYPAQTAQSSATRQMQAQAPTALISQPSYQQTLVEGGRQIANS